MISTETVTIDGREFTHTYSDTYLIRKVGTDEVYDDAIDILPFEYEETDELVPQPEPTTENYERIIDILTGEVDI